MSSFSMSSSSESQRGLHRLDGEVYEYALINLFAQEGTFRHADFVLLKSNLVLNFYKDQGTDKDIDIVFIPKLKYSLSNLKDLWDGRPIHLLGGLKQHFEVEPGNQEAVIIPEEALVFVEMKKSHEKFIHAVQEQNNNLILFLKWLQDGMKSELFENNDIDEELRAFIKPKKELELYLIVSTNGDSTQLPTKERVKGALTYTNFEEAEPKRKPFEGRTELEDIFRSEDQTIKVNGVVVKVMVLFLYVPNYVSNKFVMDHNKKLVAKKFLELDGMLRKQGEEHREKLRKQREEHDAMMRENAEMFRENIEKLREQREEHGEKLRKQRQEHNSMIRENDLMFRKQNEVNNAIFKKQHDAMIREYGEKFKVFDVMLKKQQDTIDEVEKMVNILMEKREEENWKGDTMKNKTISIKY